MKSLSSIVKSGFILTADKFKLFIVVTCSTLLLIQTVEFIFKKVDPQNQVLWLLGVILIENFLTCGVYGSLKKILSGTRFSGEMFLLNAISFFIRFLLIKLIFITSFFILGGLGLLIAEATGKIPIFAAAGIVLILLVWLAFPAYYFVLSLFAPIVLFSQNTGLIQSFKTAIYFSRKNLEKIIILVFSYLVSIALIVYFPEKAYNLSSVVWTFYKAAAVSFFEVGFISSLLLLYEKEFNNERNV